MAKARKLSTTEATAADSPEFRQLLLFERAPVDRRAPPFLVDLLPPDSPGPSTDPAAEVANFFAAGLINQASSQSSISTPDARVSISPAPSSDLAPGSGHAHRGRSSGFIRRNRSKKPVAAPSLDFLCGTLDEDDDGNLESSSCYVALSRMIDRKAAGTARKKKAAGGDDGNSGNGASGGDARGKIARKKKAAVDPYDRSDDLDDEDPDGLRLQLSPEQLARMEEVHRSWKPKQAMKRNMNYRPPMGVVEVETQGVLDTGPRKRLMADDAN